MSENSPKVGGSTNEAFGGTVLSASRRKALILPHNRDFASTGIEVAPTFGSAPIEAHLAARALDVSVGDIVEVAPDPSTPDAFVVQRRCDAKNVLERYYFNQTRRIAANVDHLLIGAAVAPLFNTAFIDRLATCAILQEIPFTLVVNKVDLGVDSTRELVETYQRIGFHVLLTSAHRGDGIAEIRSVLMDPQVQVVVVAGVSGVGKSTIINALLPDAQIRTNEVSERTGQGRQTTSQPYGHLMHRTGLAPVVIADLPGIQRFGTAHLDPRQIPFGFTEILQAGRDCPFDDCGHLDEDDCAVKRAVEAGQIAFSRYQSYIEMRAESLESREFE